MGQMQSILPRLHDTACDRLKYSRKNSTPSFLPGEAIRDLLTGTHPGIKIACTSKYLLWVFLCPPSCACWHSLPMCCSNQQDPPQPTGVGHHHHAACILSIHHGPGNYYPLSQEASSCFIQTIQRIGAQCSKHWLGFSFLDAAPCNAKFKFARG